MASLANKLDNLGYDIVSLLEKHEPNMLRWTEILAELWEVKLYKFKYKDKKVFGAAISPRLSKLVGSDQIRKAGMYYGTKISKPPEQNTSHLGFFAWLEKRAERKRFEREQEKREINRQIRELECDLACSHAQNSLKDNDPEYLQKCDKIRLKKRKEYGLDDA